MTRTEDGERRRARRFQLDAPVSAITRSEQVILGGYSVNVSAAGILVSFPPPALPLTTGDRCLLSLHLIDGVLHVVGQVRRKELGDDDLYYLGIEFERLDEHELARMTQHAHPHAASATGWEEEEHDQNRPLYTEHPAHTDGGSSDDSWRRKDS